MKKSRLISSETLKPYFAAYNREEVQKKDLPLHLKPSAVLIPISVYKKKAHIILTLRSLSLSRHQGQVSFPGGTISKEDESVYSGALREAKEEIGVDPKHITFLGALSPVVTPFQFIIYPFAVFYDMQSTTQLKPESSEVEDILFFPMDRLLFESPTIEDVMVQNLLVRNREGFWVKSQFVWGATMTILMEVRQVLLAGIEKYKEEIF